MSACPCVLCPDCDGCHHDESPPPLRILPSERAVYAFMEEHRARYRRMEDNEWAVRYAAASSDQQRAHLAFARQLTLATRKFAETIDRDLLLLLARWTTDTSAGGGDA